MRPKLGGIASVALAFALLRCSLVVDTDGLSGGSLADAPSGETASGVDGGGSSTTEGGVAPFDAGGSSLGPVWLAYGSSTGAVGVRQLVGGRWSSELPGPDVNGALVRWVVPKETPMGSFLAVMSSGANGSRLDVFERSDGAWKLGFTQPMVVTERRAFDIEYETRTNGVIVVYGDATAQPKARRRTPAGWSSEVTIPQEAKLRPIWIELTRNPLSDEVAVVFADDGQNLSTSLWNGMAWSKPFFLEGELNTDDFKCFDAAYENATGKLLIGWGRFLPTDGGNTRDMRWITHPFGGSFGDVSSAASNTPPGSMAMASESGSSRIAVSFMEYFCNSQDNPCDDFKGLVWDGTHFATETSIDSDTTTLYHSRPSTTVAGVAWLGTTGVAIAAYHRDLAMGPGALAYSRFSAGTWGPVLGANAPPTLPPRANLQLFTAGSSVVAVVEDTGGQLWSKGYAENGASSGMWTDVGGGAPLATSLVATKAVPFGVTAP